MWEKPIQAGRMLHEYIRPWFVLAFWGSEKVFQSTKEQLQWVLKSVGIGNLSIRAKYSFVLEQPFRRCWGWKQLVRHWFFRTTRDISHSNGWKLRCFFVIANFSVISLIVPAFRVFRMCAIPQSWIFSNLDFSETTLFQGPYETSGVKCFSSLHPFILFALWLQQAATALFSAVFMS